MSVRFRTSAAADRPGVVDLRVARRVRHAPVAHWFCPVCDLLAGDFSPTECAYLANVHDQIQHGSRPTAEVVAGAAGPTPSTATDLGIGA
jgi:hypothetical protein